MDEWLEHRADALSAGAGVPRQEFDLSTHEIEVLLDVAGHAAQASGARTNAPLLCYLLGRALGELKAGSVGGQAADTRPEDVRGGRTAAMGLDELVEIVRSTS